MDTKKHSVTFVKNFTTFVVFLLLPRCLCVSVVFLVFPLCLRVSVVYSFRFSLNVLHNFQIKNKIMTDYSNLRTFDELIEREHGKIGTESRNLYEEKATMFIVSEMLKEARREANLTQEQLAEKAGTKKSYISKIENGKGNIQLSTLIRIFETGLNKKIGLTFL